MQCDKIGIYRKSEYLFIFRYRNMNKLHYSVHGRTAAELIAERADATLDNMYGINNI